MKKPKLSAVDKARIKKDIAIEIDERDAWKAEATLLEKKIAFTSQLLDYSTVFFFDDEKTEKKAFTIFNNKEYLIY